MATTWLVFHSLVSIELACIQLNESGCGFVVKPVLDSVKNCIQF